MKHCGAETINIRSRFNSAAEKLGWGVAHGADSGNTLFLLLCHPPCDAEIDQHHTPVVAINHQICRLEIAIDDRFRTRMKILEHIGNLHPPVSYGFLVEFSAWSSAHTGSEVTTRNVLHDKVEAIQGLVIKIIVDSGDGRVFERCQEQ